MRHRKQYQKTRTEPTALMIPVGSPRSKTRKWFSFWHDTVGGPDNISATARDAVLQLLQMQMVAREGRTPTRVKRPRSFLQPRIR